MIYSVFGVSAEELASHGTDMPCEEYQDEGEARRALSLFQVNPRFKYIVLMACKNDRNATPVWRECWWSGVNPIDPGTAYVWQLAEEKSGEREYVINGEFRPAPR